jgi:hypothetical protein
MLSQIPPQKKKLSALIGSLLTGLASVVTILAYLQSADPPPPPSTSLPMSPPLTSASWGPPSSSESGESPPLSSTSPPSPPPMTRYAYVLEADALCAEALVNLAGQSSSDEAAFNSETVRPLAEGYGALHEKLRQLPMPPGDETTIGGILESLRAGVDRLRAAQQRVDTDLGAGYADFQRGVTAIADFTQRASEYGVTGCGG